MVGQKSDFREDSYRSASDFIEAKLILGFLKKLYKKKLDSSKYNFPDEIPEDNRISNQFAFIHEKMLKKKLDVNKKDDFQG